MAINDVISKIYEELKREAEDRSMAEEFVILGRRPNKRMKNIT